MQGARSCFPPDQESSQSGLALDGHSAHPISDRRNQWLVYLRLLGMSFARRVLPGFSEPHPPLLWQPLALPSTRMERAYAALECRSMILGAVAFFAYALLVGWVLRRYKPHALFASLALIPTWFVVSLGLWFSSRGTGMTRIEVNWSSLKETKPQ